MRRYVEYKSHVMTLNNTLQLERDFAFGLYELDYDVFGVHIEGAVNRVPCLENVNIAISIL